MTTARVTESGGGGGAARRAVRVASPQGLHARPAARVVATARRFRASVWLLHGDVRASAKDLLDVLQMAAPHGTDLVVEAEGEDASPAVEAMAALFESLAGEA